MKRPVPEPGDRIVACSDEHGIITLEKPSGERFHGGFQPVEEGRPLPHHAEHLVYARDGEVYDVTPLKGHSRVATKAYREGYDRIFRSTTPSTRSPQAPN